jgi:predicted transcriptional regulator
VETLWRRNRTGRARFIRGSAPTSSPYNASMKTGLTRERMIEAIRDLPPDASVDDAIERLVFLAKIEEGLEQLDRGEGIPHDDVKRRFGM